MQEGKSMGKKKIAMNIYFIALLGAIFLNILAWRNMAFCDWYIQYVFPIWLNSYARLTSLVPFSIGEIMLVLAVGLTAFGISFFCITLCMKDKFPKWYRNYMKIYAWGALVVLYIMTCNCFILYHASDFTQKCMKREEQLVVAADDNLEVEKLTDSDVNEKSKTNYTKKNLRILRNYLVEQCNELAPTFERDEQNNIMFEGDLLEEATLAMKKLGEEYDALSGYYVTPKYLSCSEFFSQQSIMGYYFPFSMEANINSVMYITNVVPTACHELSHTKGFLYEGDANFISFLACTESDNDFVRYCGYLSVLNYVNNDFYDSIGRNKEKYKKNVRISDLVANDNVFLTKEDWEEVEKKAVVKTETVKKVSKQLMDTSMKLNGVEEGMQQYSEVVNLLLDYYENKLY